MNKTGVRISKNLPLALCFLAAMILASAVFYFHNTGRISSIRMGLLLGCFGLTCLSAKTDPPSAMRIAIEGKNAKTVLDSSFRNLLFLGSIIIAITDFETGQTSIASVLLAGIAIGTVLFATDWLFPRDPIEVKFNLNFDTSRPISQRKTQKILYYVLPFIALIALINIYTVPMDDFVVPVYLLIIVLQTALGYYPVKKLDSGQSWMSSWTYIQIVTGWAFLALSLLCTLLF